MDDAFELVLRGYMRSEVDQLVLTVQAGLRAPGSPIAAEALRQLSEARFAVVMRGYNKRQVDEYLDVARQRLQSAALD